MLLIKQVEDGHWELFYHGTKTRGNSVIQVMDKYEKLIGLTGCAFVVAMDYGKIVETRKSFAERITREEEGAMNENSADERAKIDAFRYTESANKCESCGQSPDICKYDTPFGNTPNYEMYCKRCDVHTMPWPYPEEAMFSWNKMNPKEEDVLVNIEDLNKCRVCGGNPVITHRLSNSTLSCHEIGCVKCQRWTGQEQSIKEAVRRWDDMNPTEEPLIEGVNRCNICGARPYLKRYNGTMMYAPVMYEIGCRDCKRSSTVCETLDMAKACWGMINPPKIMQGKRVNSCITCGTEVQVRFDKGRKAYEIECMKCGRALLARKLEDVISEWNIWNAEKPQFPTLKCFHELERLQVSEVSSINACIKKLEEVVKEKRDALNARWNGTDYGSSLMPFTLVEQIKKYEYGISRLQHLLIPKFEIKEENHDRG